MPKTVKELEIVRVETPCKIDRKMHAADKILNSKICVKTHCQRGYSPMMSNKSK